MANYETYFEIAESADESTFLNRLVRFAESRGFPLINATAVLADPTPARLRKLKCVRKVPPGWEEQVYEPEAAQRDPCCRMLRKAYRPFAYDQATYVEWDAADLWEEQAKFGYRTGVNAVLHAENGRHFYIGLDREEPLPADQNALMRVMADLQLMTSFVQDTAFRLLLPTEVDETASEQLTARQLEVLKWASAGKSAWETGAILAISESTVAKHLEAARQRLGCSSKAQAVARAFSQGLL